jgi:hypothetical protein
MEQRSSGDWAQVIAGLEADRDKAEAALAGIAAERQPLALPSLSGDKAAARAVAELGKQDAELRSHLATLDAALVDAGQRRAQAAAAEAAVAAAARLGRLRAIGRELVRAAAEVDGAAAALAGALDRHRQLAAQLAGAGMDPGALRKLRSGTMIAGSLHTAGLGGHVSLPPVSPSFREPLAAWNGRMLGSFLGTEDPPAPAQPAGKAA